MTVFEQQQRLVFQILRLEARLFGEAVILGQRNHEGLLVQRPRVEPIQIHRQRQHTQVDLPVVQFFEHLPRLILIQPQLESWQ